MMRTICLVLCMMLGACSGRTRFVDDIEHRESTALCGWHVAIMYSVEPAVAARGGCVLYAPPQGVAITPDGADPCDVIEGDYTAQASATVDIWTREPGDPRADAVRPSVTACAAPAVQTCTVGADGWHIDTPGAARPDPLHCSGVDGHYICPAQDCTALPYAGDCPHCSGGGE